MMKNKWNQLLVVTLIFLSNATYAQKERIMGFWEIKKVTVGEEIMTPVAKWTKINLDGTYQSGNGWLQNTQGNWSYDIENNKYSTIDSLDIADEFGGFNVSFDRDNMIWTRMEEGMPVKVTLFPIQEMPMSPADYLEGIWDLIEITKNNKSIINDFDAKNKHKLFMRWDRVYINFNPKGEKLYGYWHIHGHKPIITLIPHLENQVPEKWMIVINNTSLIMTGASKTNQDIQRKYVRQNSF